MSFTSISKPRPQSLSRNHRLHYSWEYRRFFEKAQVYRLRECTVFRIPNELGHYRLGITMKAKGSSVERNRVKRQIRESFRIQAAILGAFDYNVVIAANRKMAHPYPERLGKCIKTDLADVLKRA